MIDLKTTLNLPLDMTIMAKAQAFNSKGWSLMPNDETTDIVKVKFKPTGSPVITSATPISSSSILLSWSALTGVLNTGNSPITIYKIYWDQGIGTNPLVYKLSNTGQTNITIPVLTLGSTYVFSILAQNKYGDGPLSTTTTSVKLELAPNQMSPVTITQNG